jgi:hypothetical protein
MIEAIQNRYISIPFNVPMESALTRIAEELEAHPNKWAALMAEDAIKKFLGFLEGTAFSVEAWNEESEIEIIIDLGPRRIEMQFTHADTTECRISRVTGSSVTRWNPARRPFDLRHHAEWLLGHAD